MLNYNEQILALNSPSFKAIRNVAWNAISSLESDERDRLWNELKRGTALLDSHEQMCQYIYSFGNMHQAKLLEVFKSLPIEFFQQDFEVVDWGCGQAMGTVNLFDFIQSKDLELNVKKVTLIEPSNTALQRGLLHATTYLSNDVQIVPINEFFENIDAEVITSKNSLPVIHIFSNILDVEQIDLKHLANLIDSTAVSTNYLVCVGPLNPTNQRIDAFFRYFDNKLVEKVYEFETYSFVKNSWTYKGRIYKLEYSNTGHLSPINNYPTVQFQAAFELDAIRISRTEKKTNYSDKFSHFEVAAPFDLGAHVYSDVEPILAVLNNVITRGLPTKSSIYIEEEIAKAFTVTQRETHYGEIKYPALKNLDFYQLEDLYHSSIDCNIEFSQDDLINLQLLLSPIAIARFQKVLLEALITGHLSLEKSVWKVMVEEKDVPFACLALQDFKQIFTNLTDLSQEYNHLIFPEIELSILTSEEFFESPLHLDAKVYKQVTNELKNKEFDLVISLAMLKSVDSSIEEFNKFNCSNNCYFNIQSVKVKRKERVLFTSNLIKYNDLIEKTPQGDYLEKKEMKSRLTYFLQLLFRKENFRPGQLPILDRALKNLPVIGLLPTGGGKSLTYQISALLQPGITMVIDPLKSLMKDQYDGLISSGIDCIAYINSSLSREEKKRNEILLESSQLLFVFLSPERLSIASFRERLRNMHEYNVYFSYGVIDEVHCVSEWGHDFRFSYLHLGRNLYNYVRAKEGEISLFGLTATASFDVLADVERELSGNDAFTLDADVIVRSSNTNRLELQYKIEKVSVQFEEDKYYDKFNKMPSHLPKALNITNHWSLYDSKGAFLTDYISKIPTYINKLQEEANINYIKDNFIDRQNNNEGIEVDLTVDMPDEFYKKNDDYKQAGIVFCPHVKSTGISVRKNNEQIKDKLIPDVGSFTGKDDDTVSMKSLENFRDNKSPLMVATKAFGMGIDKPNVRFTINMNYSSSLEAFVQEAGRAGRDKKIALATILVSDYKLVKVSASFNDRSFPFDIIRNKWFIQKDLDEIFQHFDKEVPEEHLMFATPSNDIVKLHCSKDNRMFAFNECSTNCNAYNNCILKNVSHKTKGWKTETNLLNELRAQGINLSKKNFQYLNADYQTVMFFFNESFKGDIIEKSYMNKLLNTIELQVQKANNESSIVPKIGFLQTLIDESVNQSIIVYIPYTDDNVTDLSKAIYRMCCIELIEDFTQDYRAHKFRIVATRKSVGEYYQGLKRFLLRYYTLKRAEIELQKVVDIPLKGEQSNEIQSEIYKCLAYLTEFVYDKISEKRKRAIDDMRNFCMEGLNEEEGWLVANEKLKDFIYYYFNSKYAKSDYIADNGEPFSLVLDTQGGKKSDKLILLKYLRVIDDELVGVGTPLDNIKHLYGAVKLISRSLTDSNPTLALLESYCLAYLGVKKNKNLKKQLLQKYSDGMIEFSNRFDHAKEFWDLFEVYNKALSIHLTQKQFHTLKEETSLLVHSNILDKITSNYTGNYE